MVKIILNSISLWALNSKKLNIDFTNMNIIFPRLWLAATLIQTNNMNYKFFLENKLLIPQI